MNMNRRVFLKSALSAGVLAAGSETVLSGCVAVRREHVEPEWQASGGVLKLDDRGMAILRYASLAPSGHNTQPWFVRRSDKQQWIVGADLKHRLPAVDPNNRELLLSIGAFVENLAIAAAAFGYKAQTEVIATSRFQEDLVKVTFWEVTPSGYPIERLARRRTVRKRLLPAHLKNDDIRALYGPLGSGVAYYHRRSTEADFIRHAALEAFRHQTYRHAAQGELANWIRFSNSDARLYRDGLTAETMEIPGVRGWLFRASVDRDDVMKDRFRELSVDATAELVAQGGGWLVITSNGDSVSDLIETGRRFERMFLLARERNVAVHPMTQMLEEEPWCDEIASHLNLDGIPQFVVRLGYLVDYPDPVSLRRPVNAFLRA